VLIIEYFEKYNNLINRKTHNKKHAIFNKQVLI
jgi:hypothetical protein